MSVIGGGIQPPTTAAFRLDAETYSQGAWPDTSGAGLGPSVTKPGDSPPILNATADLFNGRSRVSFDGATQALITPAMAIAAQPYTIALAGRMTNWVGLARLIDAWTVATGHQTIVTMNPNVSRIQGYSGLFGPSNGSADISAPFFAEFLFSGAGSSLRINNGPAIVANASTNPLTTPMTIGRQADAAIGYCPFEITDLIIYARAFSAGDRAAWAAYNVQRNGLPDRSAVVIGQCGAASVQRKQMNAFGDSMSSPNFVACGGRLMHVTQACNILNGAGASAVPWQNAGGGSEWGIARPQGTASATILGEDTLWSAASTGYLGPAAQAPLGGGDSSMDAGLDTTVVLFRIGSNDITGGRTLAQIKADMTTAVANRRTALSTMKALICTIIPRGSWTAAQQLIATQWNDFIRVPANLATIDPVGPVALCDVAALAVYGTGGQIINGLTAYTSDSGQFIHPNPYGHLLEGQLIAAQVLAQQW